MDKILVLSFILFYFSVNADNKESDKVRDIFSRGIELYEKGDLDSSLILLKRAESLLQSNEDLELTLEINKYLGDLYIDNHSFDSVIKYCKKTIKLKKEIGFTDSLVGDYIRLCFTFLEKGIVDTALIYIDTARFYQKQTGAISTSLENNTGRVYLDKGDFEKALEHFFVALENAHIEKDTLNLIFINLNIGTLYQRMEKYDKALDFYLVSYELSKLSNSLEGMATAYSIGIVYRIRGDYNKALEYYTRAIPICEKLGKYIDLSNIYSNMSNVYMQTQKYDKAENVLQKSIKLSSESGFQRQLGIAYANLGKTKELMGQSDSAVFYLKKSLGIVEKLGAENLRSAVLRLTSEAYESGGDFESALFYHRLHIELADSIFSENVEKQIAELQTKYETEKKEKENNLLKKDIDFEKRKSNYFIIISIILFLMGVVSLALFYFIRKSAITKKQLAQSEATRLEAELESQKRELTLGALSLSRNIEFINSLIEELKDLSDCVSEEGLPNLNNIVKKLARQQSDSSWKEFEKRFSEIHSDFYSQLLQDYPHITQSEVKLSAFLKLGMNTKEICAITFQSVRAVEAARLRLRKKLDLSSGDNLCMFLQKF